MLDVKVKNKLFTIGIIIFIYILCLTVGYALFSESLTINGVASTIDYYSGENLPLVATIRDEENNTYYTASDTKNFVVFNSEEWQDDTYTLNFDKKFGIMAGSKTITYTVTFTNPTVLPFTEGSIETEIIDNFNSRLKDVSGEISKTEVLPGESVDVNFTITFDFLTQLGSHSAKATVNYLLQNKQRHFYFIINYSNN